MNAVMKRKKEIVLERCRKYNKGDDFMYDDSVIESNVAAVEQMLNITSSDLVFNNITPSTLKAAAEMFMYLNSCSFDLIPLVKFFKDLLMNKRPDIILLTLNRMLKVKDKTDTHHFKRTLRKIFDTTYYVFSKDYSKMKNMTWKQIGNDALLGGKHHNA